LVNSNDIIDALILLLQDIPDLVTAVGGDETRIFAYKDVFPGSISLRDAIYKQPTPSVMVAFQGRKSGGGNHRISTIRHNLLVIVRPSSVADYAEIVALILEGTPTSTGLPIGNVNIADCLPFGGDDWDFQRESDENGIDYYTLLLNFEEA
jgi:hypothetical protein